MPKSWTKTKATYSKKQSTVIALWTLALQHRANPKEAIKDAIAPSIVADVVNQLGEKHNPGSILQHKHGYDMLLIGRKIDWQPTKLQRQIADELLEERVISKVHEC